MRAVNAQRANEIQVLLEGVPLPASRAALVRYARGEDRDAAALLLQLLPDREYDRLDEVGEALMDGAKPPSPSSALPIPESGKPPGGDDYLQPFPESGAVEEPEPPTDVLEQQAKTQKKQKAKQEAGS